MSSNILKNLSFALALTFSPAISQAQTTTKVSFAQCLDVDDMINVRDILENPTSQFNYFHFARPCFAGLVTIKELEELIKIGGVMKGTQLHPALVSLQKKGHSLQASLDRLEELKSVFYESTKNPLMLLQLEKGNELFAKIMEDYNGITREQFKSTFRDQTSAFRMLIVIGEKTSLQTELFTLIDNWYEGEILDQDFKTQINSVIKKYSSVNEGTNSYKLAMRDLIKFLQDGWISEEEKGKPVVFDPVKSKEFVGKFVYASIKGKHGIAINFEEIVTNLNLSGHSFNQMLTMSKK